MTNPPEVPDLKIRQIHLAGSILVCNFPNINVSSFLGNQRGNMVWGSRKKTQQ